MAVASESESITLSHHHPRFSEAHEFEKPNDENALMLMNSCAISLLDDFPDIVFAYGVSDEYSFVFKKSSQIYKRRASKILSTCVSLFSSTYVMKWAEFFPNKPLKYAPSFDGRVVLYPTVAHVHDYLSWRQVDCHINNQYNTCLWTLVKSGKTNEEAQKFLKGTQKQEKNEILFQQFGINYNTLPPMFRKGSCVFREEVHEISKSKKVKKKVVVDHCDIICPGDMHFWNEHPYILSDDQ
ncbi:tRNA(His) guanylyltransferase 1 isoform X2 [Amborella trichopoda]|uniref:tRNA(His) guanylyltransferase 1 isoform X2 n=1 Tax=Amborella trichopoda TaxID=13333 RepID=UPI0009BF3F50|nr:tRNA(His) guanylyltransferase 1 isoform X2 [Amborella trichopoda]|eukprot:XP_020519391.1 tRNA(His) guanylyltransferase 1 isoform X2 [Amborella trichopoda]